MVGSFLVSPIYDDVFNIVDQFHFDHFHTVNEQHVPCKLPLL